MSTVVNVPRTSAPTTQAERQPLLFLFLRWRLVRNGFDVLQREAPVRLITILICSLVVWSGTFAASFEGFRYIHRQFSLFGVVAGILFDMLYLALAALLIFSTGLILYSSLFRSAETAFLLGTPAAADQVFAYKYQGAVAFSSWAFVLLGSPTLIAYGMILDVAWYFYASLPLFFLGYVLLPGSFGALICLLVVNCFPRRAREVLMIAGVLAGFLAFGWLYHLVTSARTDLVSKDGIQRLLGQFNFARGPMSPNHWMSQGLQAAARGQLSQVAYYLALIWSNGLVLYLLTTWAAATLYRRGYNRVATGGFQRRRYGGSWLDFVFTGFLGFFVHPQVRLLIVKDFRTFRRDPAQWAQVLIFTGLLTLYFLNVRRFYRDDYGTAYQASISLLNLTATSFLLCAYTGRFIFPMLSLEGRKFWILGLLPLERERLLWGKFVFSTLGGLFIAEFLVLLSDFMLSVPWLAIGLHSLTVLVVSAGLSGLSVGLGAWMPNFRENDPSKIAAATGGTLNLVAGLLFILVVLALMVLPWHLETAAGREPHWWDWEELIGPVLGVVGGVGVGLSAVFLPLWLGAGSLRRMEF